FDGLERRGRGLDEGAQLVSGREGESLPAEGFLLLPQELADPGDFLHIVHQGEENAHVAVRGGAQEGPELGSEELESVQADTDGAPAEEGILLDGHMEEHRELVAAEVEGAD